MKFREGLRGERRRGWERGGGCGEGVGEVEEGGEVEREADLVNDSRNVRKFAW